MDHAEQVSELIELHRERLRVLRAILEWEYEHGDRWRQIELDTGTAGRRERTRVRREITEALGELKRLGDSLGIQLRG